jgi:hypothetical protein
MSRSNYDKPFYVDIGTSIVAVRCASNHDVVAKYDYIWCRDYLKMAEELCDRLNKEAEIGKPPRPLRNCDVGDAEEQYARFKKWCEGEFYKRPMNALTGEPCKSCPCYSVSANGVDGCNYLRWANMTYEKEGEE